MKPFIVAEIGGNHNGSLRTCHDLIEAAKAAGADAVKFQTWEADTMAIPGYIIQGGPWDGRELLDLYRETHTPWHWHPRLFQHALDIGLVPFSAPFDAPSVTLLEKLDCPIYKIASFEVLDLPLLRRIAATGKPVIMSTGMASDLEIKSAINTLTKAGTQDLTLLHCVSNYPTKLEDANIGRIALLKSLCQKVGISDHSQGHLVGVAATALGAEVIEKHLILSRLQGGPDAAFSMEPAEFKAMVEAVKSVSAMLKTPIHDSQKKNRLLRRSLYYARDLPKGHVLTEGDFITRRPALGLDPVWLYRIIGKPLLADVSHNKPASLLDVE